MEETAPEPLSGGQQNNVHRQRDQQLAADSEPAIQQQRQIRHFVDRKNVRVGTKGSTEPLIEDKEKDEKAEVEVENTSEPKDQPEDTSSTAEVKGNGVTTSFVEMAELYKVGSLCGTWPQIHTYIL
jgi:hypothetical protein